MKPVLAPGLLVDKSYDERGVTDISDFLGVNNNNITRSKHDLPMYIEFTENLNREEFKYDNCPTDFEYNEKYKECRRKVLINNEKFGFYKSIILIRNKSKERLVVTGWKVIECD